jgi:uncharacterized protein YfaT (DUF1175 family)
MGLFDGIRNLFNVRVSRGRADRGPKPRLGARICHGDVRISVQSGLTDDTWSWLQEQGWREVTFRPDRRRYRDVPPSLVTKLFDAVPTDRLSVLKEAMSAATAKPLPQTIRRG